MRIETIAMLALCGGMVAWGLLTESIILLKIALIAWIVISACFVYISDQWHYWYSECKKREEEKL